MRTTWRRDLSYLCLLIASLADGSWRNATANLEGGSSTTLAARLQYVELSQGEYGMARSQREAAKMPPKALNTREEPQAALTEQRPR
jgi:hypothetical protein